MKNFTLENVICMYPYLEKPRTDSRYGTTKYEILLCLTQEQAQIVTEKLEECRAEELAQFPATALRMPLKAKLTTTPKGTTPYILPLRETAHITYGPDEIPRYMPGPSVKFAPGVPATVAPDRALRGGVADVEIVLIAYNIQNSLIPSVGISARPVEITIKEAAPQGVPQARGYQRQYGAPQAYGTPQAVQMPQAAQTAPQAVQMPQAAQTAYQMPQTAYQMPQAAYQMPQAAQTAYQMPQAAQTAYQMPQAAQMPQAPQAEAFAEQEIEDEAIPF